MTEQIKKLNEILLSENLSVIQITNLLEKIIKAFPQITKKPVKIVKIPSSNGLFGIKFDEVNGSGNERQAWIDSHFCEVVE